MHAGEPPFVAVSEHYLFDKIMNREIATFPKHFDEVTCDIINRLLVLEPSDRLGAGRPGSSNDMSALKGHRYFENVDWRDL